MQQRQQHQGLQQQQGLLQQQGLQQQQRQQQWERYPQQGRHHSKDPTTAGKPATHEFWQKVRNKSLEWQKITLKVKKKLVKFSILVALFIEI
jgi:hypothetical protein